MSERLRPAPGDPCRGCPFRRDTRPGHWPPAVYHRLPGYDGDIPAQIRAGTTSPMFCYQKPLRLCSGWIACYAPDDLLALRMHTDRVNWWLVRAYTTGTDLFGSGAEAAEHGRKLGGEPWAGLPAGEESSGLLLHGAQLPRRRGTQKTSADIALDALVEEIVKAAVAWAGGDPARLDDAARILALSPHLGPLPKKTGDDALLRPRHCTTCGECPQYRTTAEGTWRDLCKCGHRVEKHSFVPYKVVYYDRERSRDEHRQEPATAG